MATVAQHSVTSSQRPVTGELCTVGYVGPAVHFGILGPLEVRQDGGEAMALGGPRQRALLAILALNVNQVVPTERLIDGLWGERPPATSVHTVQVFVSRLRRAMAPVSDRVVTRPTGYQLRVGADELDATRCEQLYAAGRAALDAGQPELAVRLLRQSDALWRGPALADFTYEPFAQAAIARFEELRLSCLDERVEAEIALGRHAALVPELEARVREHPLRERPWSQLMLALYRCDRQADALDAFQQARRLLVDELGVEPSERLRAVEAAILRHDPELDPLRPATTEQPPAPAEASPPEPVTAPAAIARRTVTVLLGAVAGRERADPELMRRLIALVRGDAARIVDRHGGVFRPGLGGELIGVFGLSLGHEDDALRAVRAADELRRSVGARAELQSAGLQIGLGLDTGELVTEGAGELSSLYGEPLEGGGALARRAGPGEVLLSDATRRLAPDAIEVARVDAHTWRLEALIAGAPALRRRHATSLVGRDTELQAALAAFERVERHRCAELLTVIGEAGLGKSRLAQEVARRVPAGTTILRVECQSYGDGSALAPLGKAISRLAGGESEEAIRGLLGDPDDAEHVAGPIAAALGRTARIPAPERVPWAFRRLIETLAQTQPLVIALEDAQWAQPTLLDLVEYLVEWLAGVPVLVLCLARPELLDDRPGWGGGRPGVASLVLAPLTDEDAGLLLEHADEQRSVSLADRERILSVAEGNPFFVEQLLAMQADHGAWDIESPLPPSVHALVAARLDRLCRDERALIERAALIGRQFWSDAVIDLLPQEAQAAAGDHLRALVRRRLIAPAGDSRPGEESLRFEQALIRDVAYRSCPKALRGRLHLAHARWLERHGGNQDELVGCHLAQAFGYRRELEQLDADAMALAWEAGGRLAAAGRDTLRRGDPMAASRLLRRAATLFEAAGKARPDAPLSRGSALADPAGSRAAAPIWR
jgi:DNA-binding SARP family transcriptional activator